MGQGARGQHIGRDLRSTSNAAADLKILQPPGLSNRGPLDGGCTAGLSGKTRARLRQVDIEWLRPLVFGVTRIVSLLPAATEIIAALGLIDHLVAVSHECDFPEAVKPLPRATHCPIHNAGLTSQEVDAWVRRSLRENGTIYTINEPLLRSLRPEVILTQKLCDVCAVGYGTVARLAASLPGPPQVINLEPTSLPDIFADIQRVAEACGVPDRAREIVADLSARVDAIRDRAASIPYRPRCYLMEWVNPPFCSGHWGPELVEIAGGYDPLGRKHQPSAQIEWEEVLEADPDIIVLALCGYDTCSARRDYEHLRQYVGFESLRAVRNGEIYLVDASAYFARPGPRIVDSLEILAGILHPDEFSEFTSNRSVIRRPIQDTESAAARSKN